MNTSAHDLNKNSDCPQAVVRSVNGQHVLDDPCAVAMICAVMKHNCRHTFELNLDRVEHFKRRIVERGLTVADVVIVILNVDDVHGGPIAGILMPGFDWQEIRNRGEVPFARGLVARGEIQEILESFDKEAAEKMNEMIEVAVLVIDHGVAEVFTA